MMVFYDIVAVVVVLGVVAVVVVVTVAAQVVVIVAAQIVVVVVFVVVDCPYQPVSRKQYVSPEERSWSRLRWLFDSRL